MQLKTLLTAYCLALISSPLLSVYAKDSFENTPRAIESIQSTDAGIVATYYKDLDEDGIRDQLDHCPNTLLNVAVDAYGCELDTDKDGVFDRLDQCPETPTGITVNVFGCEGDEDFDGVYDSKDQCPSTPSGNTVNAMGCPITIETDKDGINDSDNLCPETPLSAAVSTHSCMPVHSILTHIQFDTGSHDIRADQATIFKKDSNNLSDLKNGQVILITGHTDDQGTAPRNLRLSWRRANSAKEFIIREHGYSPDKVYISGKGDREPFTDNLTLTDRQANRSIELKVIQFDELPTDAVLQMPKRMIPR